MKFRPRYPHTVWTQPFCRWNDIWSKPSDSALHPTGNPNELQWGPHFWEALQIAETGHRCVRLTSETQEFQYVSFFTASQCNDGEMEIILAIWFSIHGIWPFTWMSSLSHVSHLVLVKQTRVHFIVTFHLRFCIKQHTFVQLHFLFVYAGLNQQLNQTPAVSAHANSKGFWSYAVS